MEDYPKTQMQFERQFSNDEACRTYLEQMRWPRGFVCPRCGETKTGRTNRGLLLCRSCGYQASVTQGTIFERSHLPLTLWFRAMWFVTNQKTGASAMSIQRALGLGGYLTAWTWLHKLRRAMVRQGRDRLAGRVEVDESYIGGKSQGKRGRGAGKKALVVLAVQLVKKNEIGRIRLAQAPDASAESLTKAVLSMVEPGAEVRTDAWNGYNDLATKGYKHKAVRQTATVGDDLLPACHRVVSLLKRWLLGTHQGAVSHKHLSYYLDEFTFRFNRRTSASRGKLFYRLIQQAVGTDYVTYSKLVSQPIGGS
jgi:transposase-like protein